MPWHQEFIEKMQFYRDTLCKRKWDKWYWLSDLIFYLSLCLSAVLWSTRRSGFFSSKGNQKWRMTILFITSSDTNSLWLDFSSFNNVFSLACVKESIVFYANFLLRSSSRINEEKEKDDPKTIPLKIFAKDIGNCAYVSLRMQWCRSVCVRVCGFFHGCVCACVNVFLVFVLFPRLRL